GMPWSTCPAEKVGAPSYCPASDGTARRKAAHARSAAEAEETQDRCMISTLYATPNRRWRPPLSRLLPEISPKTALREGAPLALFEQGEIDDVEPAEEAVDNGPQDRMVVGIGNGDGERRAEADAVFGTFDAVIDIHSCLLKSLDQHAALRLCHRA